MKVTSTPAVLLGLFATSYSYTLDISCTLGSPYEDMVNTGMQNAFDLASAAFSITNNLAATGSGAVWEAQRDIFSYLFHKALTVDNPDHDNENWKAVRGVFEHVLAFNTNQQPDLVVFCDMKRFIYGEDCDENENPDKACDEENDIVLEMTHSFKSCGGGGPGAMVSN